MGLLRLSFKNPCYIKHFALNGFHQNFVLGFSKIYQIFSNTVLTIFSTNNWYRIWTATVNDIKSGQNAWEAVSDTETGDAWLWLLRDRKQGVLLILSLLLVENSRLQCKQNLQQHDFFLLLSDLEYGTKVCLEWSSWNL